MRHKLSDINGKRATCSECQKRVTLVPVAKVGGGQSWRCQYEVSAKKRKVREAKREKKATHNERIAEWRNRCGERTGWRCEVTGRLLDPNLQPTHEDSFHAHHVIPRSKCKALIYDDANAMGLCKKEHQRFHGAPWIPADESYVWEAMWEKRPDDARHILKVRKENSK